METMKTRKGRIFTVTAEFYQRVELDCRAIDNRVAREILSAAKGCAINIVFCMLFFC
jgi:hypothetical protein